MGLVEIRNRDFNVGGLDDCVGHFRQGVLRGARWVVYYGMCVVARLNFLDR
jgi:hypothetical protein